MKELLNLSISPFNSETAVSSVTDDGKLSNLFVVPYFIYAPSGKVLSVVTEFI
jgi:hypothetical protein